MRIEKLVYMANQIGIFFATQRGDTAATQIATHLRKFWDPRMREHILAHLDRGGEGLDEPVKLALTILKPSTEAEKARPAA